MATQEVLEQIEAKVKAAAALIREAQKLAHESKVPFRVGLIRMQKYDEDKDEFVEMTADDDEYSDGHVGVEAGWAPSGLNC